MIDSASHVAGELETLALLIRQTDSAVLAFGLYRATADREYAVDELRRRLNLPITEFFLSARQNDPVALLLTVPSHPRSCILFYDLEDALPEVANYVNLQREIFSEVPHAVVFWAREHGLREIASRAPDFWSWSSGVFDFRSRDAASSLLVGRLLVAEPFAIRNRADLERRVDLYHTLIREHGGAAPPDDSFLAVTGLRLSAALLALGRLGEAEQALQPALDRSRRVGDRKLEAAAMDLLGIVFQEQGRVREAEQCYRSSLALSEQLGDEPALAVSYHQMGAIAEDQQRLEEAEKWYRKALALSEKLGNAVGTASTYQQLGTLALERGQVDMAERLYRTALPIKEGAGLPADVAAIYHQLGLVAKRRQDLRQAETWFQKALQIKEQLGLARQAAMDYYELGNVAFEQRSLDEAHQWFRKAVEVAERLDLPLDAGFAYHGLGMNAQHRGHYDEAEQWLSKALAIWDRLAHPPFQVHTLAQMGELCRQRGRLEEARAWLERAASIALGYRMPIQSQIARSLAELNEVLAKRA